MWRNRPQDSDRRAQPVLDQRIDLPVLVVSALTIFFATLFATLLLMRPESADLRGSMRESSNSVQFAPSVELPPVEAPPPELDARFEPNPKPILSPALRAQLEELGVKCAEGANCYPD